MKFSDFICREAIRANMAALDKEGAIREMVQSLVEAKRVNAAEFESIVKAILKREELGSTGIGRGVAVPHTKHPSVDRLIGTVSVSPDRRRLRQSRRRDGQLVLPPDFPARPSRRPPSRLGKHLAATPR